MLLALSNTIVFNNTNATLAIHNTSTPVAPAPAPCIK
jgi:hypothetical protein